MRRQEWATGGGGGRPSWNDCIWISPSDERAVADRMPGEYGRVPRGFGLGGNGPWLSAYGDDASALDSAAVVTDVRVFSLPSGRGRGRPLRYGESKSESA